jgi:hypothetical protein
MVPKYEDLDRINSISSELAARFAVLYDKIVTLEIENEKLTKERDEARREICDMHHMTGFLSGDYALSRGWDCFKNGYPKELSEEAIKFRNIWNAYSDKLREERDEARRIACLQSCMGDDEPREWSPEDFAKQQGWDCYKEDT